MPDTVLSDGNIKMDTVLFHREDGHIEGAPVQCGEIRDGYRGIPQEHPPTWGWEVGGASSGSEL